MSGRERESGGRDTDKQTDGKTNRYEEKIKEKDKFTRIIDKEKVKDRKRETTQTNKDGESNEKREGKNTG